MSRRILVISALLFLFVANVTAREGMWIPALLNRNIDEMQQMGFQLTADDIYSVNHASMKDAVVIFGRGCTGEMISGEGLVLTNHHCGYDAIQDHSSLEHDYLTDGFWARSRDEELPNPGLTVKFLDRMEDVTDRVMKGISALGESKRDSIMKANIKEIETSASDSGRFNTVVKPLFYGNQYFLYVYLEYTDVRLVGAPPSSIGKFGGDTDNWMWPRHTGDFSVFRVYADKDNQPAKYSKDNIPFKPKKFFPVSLKGVKANDFTMVFGYPGTTTQYLPSQAVDLVMTQSDPDRIAIRDRKLQILANQMEADRKVRIQYAAKYANISNSWKKWQGEVLGLKRLNAVEAKKSFEADFTNWINAAPDRQEKYGKVLPEFEKLYEAIRSWTRARDYYSETVRNGCDAFKMADMVNHLQLISPKSDAKMVEKLKSKLIEETENYFKDYDRATDEKMFVALMRIYRKLDRSVLPADFIKLMDSNDDAKLLDRVYGKSMLCNKEKILAFINNFSQKGTTQLQKDPLIKLYSVMKKHYAETVEPIYNELDAKILSNQKLYMEGILAMKSDKNLYPDANFTLRVSYGKVEGYQPRDGVRYDYFTTLDGIMEKDNPEIYDYNIPQKLRDLYAAKDFGSYAENGTMPVCFAASNHTTGGNSGSPVVNARGELIGINFDRCWEGTMSDLMFDPSQCRNIALDMRYVMFVIDKVAGAGYLLDEMQLIRN